MTHCDTLPKKPYILFLFDARGYARISVQLTKNKAKFPDIKYAEDYDFRLNTRLTSTTEI